MRARKFVLKNKPTGLPKTTDFALEEEEITESINDGEILCRAEYLSVDPYMRGAANNLKLGDVMPGTQVAVVLKSRCKQFPEGSRVVGLFGWRDVTLYKPSTTDGIECLYLMPDMKSLSPSLSLGAVGRPGNTAYFGLLDVGLPKPEEVVVVSAASGAVGSLVGQIAKLKGCTVIGFAGSDDKVNALLKTFGFDYAFNYKTTSVKESIEQAAPKGVDIFFDCVGGEFSYHVIQKMNPFGRIPLCGAISTYNKDPNKPALIPFDYTTMIYKNIKMEGLHVLRWRDKWLEGIHMIRDWILEGKIKVEETITEGFENMPQALIDLLQGANLGKAVVKC